MDGTDGGCGRLSLLPPSSLPIRPQPSIRFSLVLLALPPPPLILLNPSPILSSCSRRFPSPYCLFFSFAETLVSSLGRALIQLISPPPPSKIR